MYLFLINNPSPISEYVIFSLLLILSEIEDDYWESMCGNAMLYCVRKEIGVVRKMDWFSDVYSMDVVYCKEDDKVYE